MQQQVCRGLLTLRVKCIFFAKGRGTSAFIGKSPAAHITAKLDDVILGFECLIFPSDMSLYTPPNLWFRRFPETLEGTPVRHDWACHWLITKFNLQTYDPWKKEKTWSLESTSKVEPSFPPRYRA